MAKRKLTAPGIDLAKVFESQQREAASQERRAQDLASTPGLHLAPGWTIDDAYLIECYLNELNARDSEALACYKPVPGAVAYHASMAGENGIVGSNRSGKAQPWHEPVLTPRGWKPIGLLSVGDLVIGGNGKPCRVTGIFPQGNKKTYRVVFEGGARTACCAEHLWKVKIGTKRFSTGRLNDEWVVMSLQRIVDRCGMDPEAWRRPVVPMVSVDFGNSDASQPVDPYLLGLLIGDGSMCYSLSYCTEDQELANEAAGRLPDGCRMLKSTGYGYYITRTAVSGKNPLMEMLRELGLYKKKSEEKFVPERYLLGSPETRLDVLRGLMDTDGHIDDRGRMEFCTTSPRLADDVQFLIRSLGGKCSVVWRVTQYSHLGIKKKGLPSARIYLKMPPFNPFRLKRKAERYQCLQKVTPNLVMRSIHELGDDECVCISVDSPDSTYVTNDFVVTHNTVSTCVEDAWAATGRHPVEGKYPPAIEMALVGPGEKHLRLLYRVLFKPGQFKLLQDPDGSWHVPSYESPEDVARIREWQDAPPLIPPRLVEAESWIDKKAEEPALIRLINGTNIYFFSYESTPPQGVIFHRVHLDEEHPRAGMWLTEMRARVMSVRGYIDWSATPENATPAFYGLQSRANRPDQATKPILAQTKFFTLFSKDNPYLPPDARDAFFEKLREDDPDAAVAKVEGEWAFRKYLVYPEFDENKHLIESFEITHADSLYAVIDPSITRCAILLAAVLSPDHKHYLPEWPDRLIVTDECVIENCTAAKAARQLRRLLDERKHWVEKVIFDFRHGRKREDDGGMIAEKYWAAIKAEGVHPRLDRIVWGSDNYADGIDAVKEFLAPKGDKPPRIVGFKDRLRWWPWEFHRYHRVKNPDGTPGKIHRKKDDLMDATRYLVKDNPQWVTPPGLDRRTDDAFSADELRQFDRNPVDSLYGYRYRQVS